MSMIPGVEGRGVGIMRALEEVRQGRIAGTAAESVELGASFVFEHARMAAETVRSERAVARAHRVTQLVHAALPGDAHASLAAMRASTRAIETDPNAGDWSLDDESFDALLMWLMRDRRPIDVAGSVAEWDSDVPVSMLMLRWILLQPEAVDGTIDRAAVEHAVALRSRAAFDDARARGCCAEAREIARAFAMVSWSVPGLADIGPSLEAWCAWADTADAVSVAAALLNEWRAHGAAASALRLVLVDASPMAGASDAEAAAWLVEQWAQAPARAQADATERGIRAMALNPLVPARDVACVIDECDLPEDRRDELRQRWRTQWRGWRTKTHRQHPVLHVVVRVAAAMLVVGSVVLLVLWRVNESRTNERAQMIASDVMSALDPCFARGNFEHALAMFETASDEGLAGREPLIAAASALQARMEDRHRIDATIAATVDRAGDPRLESAQAESVMALRSQPLTEAQITLVDEWLRQRADAEATRAQERQQQALDAAAKAEQLLEAAANDDAAELESVAAAIAAALAMPGADDRVGSRMAGASQRLAEVRSGRAQRAEVRAREEARMRELAADLDRLHGLCGNPTRFAATLREIANERPNDEAAQSLAAAADALSTWIATEAWSELAARLAEAPFPSDAARAAEHRAALDAFLIEHPGSPWAALAKSLRAGSVVDGSWAPDSMRRVRALGLARLGLVVTRGGVRHWIDRSAVEPEVFAGRRTLRELRSHDAVEPVDVVVDVADITSESNEPFAPVLTQLEALLKDDGAAGPDRLANALKVVAEANGGPGTPEIDPVVRLLLLQSIARRGELSLPLMRPLLAESLARIDAGAWVREDWMATPGSVTDSERWKRANAALQTSGAAAIGQQLDALRDDLSSRLRRSPRPVGWLAADAAGGVITDSIDPGRAGWSVVAFSKDGAQEPLGTINAEGRVELVRPDRAAVHPRGTLVYALPKE